MRTQLKLARMARRGLAAAMVAGFLMAASSIMPAAAQQAASPEQIAAHFSSIRTMTGEFVQFGPRGEQTGGKFYIERPGRIRFNYDKPNDYRVVSDGKSVVISNTKLNTADLYPLSKTPLKLLLDERINLTGDRVQGVAQEDGLTIITLADRSVFGNSTIALMFDPQSFELRQWTIRDAQGKDTTVMIFNVQEGVRFDPKMFEIDYARVAEINSRTR